MTIISIFFYLTVVVVCFEPTPLSKPRQGALVSANLIYSSENRPTPQCHASTIAETPNGLVIVLFYRCLNIFYF